MEPTREAGAFVAAGPRGKTNARQTMTEWVAGVLRIFQKRVAIASSLAFIFSNAGCGLSSPCLFPYPLFIEAGVLYFASCLRQALSSALSARYGSSHAPSGELHRLIFLPAWIYTR